MDPETLEVKEKIEEYLSKHPDSKPHQIAAELGIGLLTVANLLADYLTGSVDRRIKHETE